MSDANIPEEPSQADSAERMAALFANLVVQQTNMALMFLGRVPHPESGQPLKDLNAARMFIDQLEMLEVKTKGNLDKREEGLLKQSLTSLRMAFVEAVNEEPSSAPKKQAAAETENAAKSTPTEKKQAGKESAGSPPEEESHKKFSKKY